MSTVICSQLFLVLRLPLKGFVVSKPSINWDVIKRARLKFMRMKLNIRTPKNGENTYTLQTLFLASIF